MKKANFKSGFSETGDRAVRIMVVDDDRNILDLVNEFLADSGYDVTMATSGEEAVELFRGKAADIVIIDLKLRGIDGITTIKRLMEISPCTVSILMTGFPTLDSSITALRLGASDYILKPFKLGEFSSAIDRAVGEWRMRVELKRLKDRVNALDGSVAQNKDHIKTNWKLGVAGGSRDGSSKFIKSPRSNET